MFVTISCIVISITAFPVMKKPMKNKNKNKKKPNHGNTTSKQGGSIDGKSLSSSSGKGCKVGLMAKS